MIKNLIPILALGAAFAAASAHGDVPTDTLKGSITSSMTLDTNKIWILSGYVSVDSPAVLTIKPGTTIKGQKSTKGTLAIKPGAKILAEGTKAMPITFTSDEPDSGKTRGSWGGIVLLGRAKTNKATNEFEGRTEWTFGGANDDDSSGVLKYVRLQNPGFPVAPDKELNGLTMGGIGRKTVINHVQVHSGDDDGFEWFGGAVSPTNLVVTNQVDDGFDSDNGFTGTVKWIVNVQGAESDRVREYIVKKSDGTDSLVKLPNEVVGDKCFESSSTKLADASPQTSPTWSNVTCIDNGKSGGAINLNEQAVGTFERVLLIGDSSAFAVKLQSAKTNAGLLANPATLSFKKSYLGGTWKSKFSTDDSSNADLIKAALGASLKPVGMPLYKDLGLANDTLKRDSVGAVLGDTPADFWYMGWTLPGTVSYAKGETRGSIAIREADRVAVPSDLFTVVMLGGNLSLKSVFNARVSLVVMDLNGRMVYSNESLRLSKGDNRLGRPWGRLNAGAYFLSIKSGNYSVNHRFEEAAR